MIGYDNPMREFLKHLAFGVYILISFGLAVAWSFVADWFYSVGIWPLGAIFRLLMWGVGIFSVVLFVYWAYLLIKGLVFGFRGLYED